MNVKEYNESVDLFSDKVYRFIFSNINDTEKAKDIVQDSYEKLWLRHKDIDFEKVKSYLFSTAYHGMIDILRREKRIAGMDTQAENKLTYNEHYSDLQEVLHQAILKLPEIQRSVILLRDYEGYSYNEIADITEISISQVKVYIYRARKFLKDYVVNIENLI